MIGKLYVFFVIPPCLIGDRKKMCGKLDPLGHSLVQTRRSFHRSICLYFHCSSEKVEEVDGPAVCYVQVSMNYIAHISPLYMI